MNFKFFRGKELNLPDQGRFNFLIEHRPRRRTHQLMYRSSMPRNQMSDEIYNEIIRYNIQRLREEAGYNGDVQFELISSDHYGFTLRFEIFS